MDQNKLDTLKHFLKYCKTELNIQSLPYIKLVNDKNWVAQNRSYGEYNPNNNQIKVFVLGRNLADVCRSLAHELVHHRQMELNMIHDGSGETGTEIENEANALAGILMRDYGKLNLSVYDLDANTPKTSLMETGEIWNPFPWQYDFIDEDGNFFYSFNTPQHKYSVGISWNGDDSYELLFNTDGDMGQDTGENVARQVLSTVAAIANDFVAKEQPEELILRPIKTKGTEDKRRFVVYGAYLKKNTPKGYTLHTMGDTYRLIKNK